MKLSTKLTLFITFLFCLASGLLCYNISTQVADDMELSYKQNYEAAAETISNNIVQMESMTESILRNTLLLFRKEDETKKRDFTTEELIKLRDHYQVSNLYLINNEGYFYRVTNDLLNKKKITPWSVFQSNPLYKVMLVDREHIEITPLLWLRKYDTPAKFAMMASSDGSKIIEVGINTDITGKILKQGIKAYPAINSMTIKTPTGQILGTVNQGETSDKSIRISRRVEAGKKICHECARKDFTVDVNDYHYILNLDVSTAPLIASIRNAQLKVLGIFTTITLIMIMLVAFFVRKFMVKLSVVHDVIKHTIDTGDLTSKIDESGNDEVADLAKSFNNMMDNLQDSQNKLLEVEKLKIFHKTATQVAHDIRSPLTLLNLALQDAKDLPEQERGMIRSAVNKISDILFNMVPEKKFENEKESKHKIMLSALIEQIVAEKRYEYKELQNLDIHFDSDFDSYGVFLDLEVMNLKRCLSNIINNAVEALDQKSFGEIALSAKRSDKDVIITIRDNGKGISKDYIDKVLDDGFTNGKKNGSGKGLAFANEFAISSDGQLKVQSIEGQSTEIILTLPISKTPSWFLSNLTISSDTKVVVIDDDYSIHKLWDRRFNEVVPQTQLIHLYNKQSALEWLNDNNNSKVLFLIDYEFVNLDYNGLDIITELEIENKSVLVTSHFEDEEILMALESNMLPMIPKATAINVPIDIIYEIEESDPVVILDDDIALTKNIARYFSKRNRLIHIYNTTSQLLHELDRFPKNTKFLVDLNIHGDEDGLGVCEALADQGYSRVHLFTGDSKISISEYDFIKSIVEKGGLKPLQEILENANTIS